MSASLRQLPGRRAGTVTAVILVLTACGFGADSPEAKPPASTSETRSPAVNGPLWMMVGRGAGSVFGEARSWHATTSAKAA